MACCALDRDTHAVMYETPVTTRENAETPVITTPTRACPGVLGGTEWNGPAYNPATNLLYVPAVDWCATFTAYEQVRFIPGKGYMGGRTDLDPIDKSQGWLTAIDAATGAVKWKYRSPRPLVAAVTTTAGNIVMTGELTGDFTILDARSGRCCTGSTPAARWAAASWARRDATVVGNLLSTLDGASVDSVALPGPLEN